MFDHTAAVESNHIFESPTVQLLCRTTNHWSSQVIGKRKVTFRGLTFCKAILISCLSVSCCMISVLESYGLLCQIVICGKIERSQLVQYSINNRLSIRTRDLSRDDWIKEFIKRKWSSGLVWAVGAAERKKLPNALRCNF